MLSYNLEAEIFAAGSWNEREYSITDLENIAANFRKYQTRIKPPLKLGHRQDDPRGQPALGWVKDLYVRGQKLVASFTDVPAVVYKAIRQGLYRRISSELWQAEDGFILKAVALLGADLPAVDTLEDLTVYFAEDPGLSLSQTLTLEFDMTNLKIKPDSALNFEELYNVEKAARLASEKKLSTLQKLEFEKQRATALERARLTCLSFTEKGLLPPYIKDLLLDAEGLRTDKDGVNIVIPFDIFVKLLEMLPENVAEKGLQGEPEDEDPAAEIDRRAKEIVERDNVDYIRPLAKLRLPFKITNTGNEIKSQAKALSAVTITFG